MMKTTALSLILGTMFVVGAAQAQPAKLTTSQMDQVTAGDITQANVSDISQRARVDVDACGDAGAACNTSNYDTDYSGNVRARAEAEVTNYASVVQANVITFGD
jgi:hypothetical protein